MSSQAKTVCWVIAVLVGIASCAGVGGSGGSKTTTTGPGSSSCAQQGKQEFTSFSSPEWKRYVAECAPADVK